jgi:hypothetical protein
MFINRFYIFFRLLSEGKIKYLYASFRRRFIFYFNQSYFRQQITRRKGNCSGSGHCCAKTMPWCVYSKDHKCVVYEKQPFFCKIFPIDEKDIELSDVKGICGYRFDNETSPNASPEGEARGGSET